MADDEAIDDIMNSPSKPSSPPQQDVSRPQTASELPGGIDDEEPSAQQLEEKRPSTTLEVDPEGGVATMSESNVLPARLPPLNNGPDGLEGPNRQNIDLVSNISETEANINELLNTLECPVCLDTADSAPIYQCPEGHLLCERCNQRLVDCPQCGHALMNSRNRIAEDLAVKLQILRGSSTGASGSQKISIAVSEPHKAKKGWFRGVVYTIVTKYYGDKFNEYGANSHFSVSRSYSDIKTLYEYLNISYKKLGVIIPPPPPKANLGFVDTVNTAGPKTLASSSALRSIDKKCVALDRYMKRLAKHPVVRKDAMFRSFIQDKEVAKSLKPVVTFKTSISNFKSRIDVWKSKLVVTEKDAWFKTRNTQLKALRKQMNEMHKTLDGMAKLKHELHEKSDDFRRDLVLLLVGRSTVRENDFTHTLDQVVDAQRVMSTMYDEQADADDHIVQIAGDYMLLIDSAQEVLERRRKVLMDYEKEMKKSNKAAKDRLKKVEAETSEAPIEEMDTDGHNTEKSELEHLEQKFVNISQTLRRELEHFDFVMREEFEKAFAAYSATYWSSLSKTKVLDINTSRPNTEMLALTAEGQYEEMSAMSYHM